MNDKIKSALSSNNETSEKEIEPEAEEVHPEKDEKPAIVTTDEELEAYFIIKSLLKDATPIENITYRDTASYINVLYKDNGRKWICRLILTDTQKILIIPDESKNPIKYTLENIYDIAQYQSQLLEVLNRYLE
ncbi:hypothetical protein F1912_12120 [Akkermansia muciniphila]|nr:hypothetical protein F1912_12120 [Akkermansia muciniphila]